MFPWVWYGEWLRLPTYLTCLAVGFAAATFVVRREARRSGLPVADLMDLVVWLVPTVIVGARLAHVVWVAPRLTLDDPWSAVSYAYGGFVFYGGLAAGAAVSWRFARHRGLDPWAVADVFAPATAFGLVFGRLGCLGAGCCFGRPAAWPLGVEVPWAIRMYGRGYVPDELLGVSLHPAPLYEAAVALASFVALSWLRTLALRPGSVALMWLVAYGLLRAFVLEPFRADDERGVYLDGWVSTSQAVGVVTAVLAAGVAAWRRR